jgi:hypothetical protein
MYINKISRDVQPMYIGSIQENFNKEEKEAHNNKISRARQLPNCPLQLHKQSLTLRGINEHQRAEKTCSISRLQPHNTRKNGRLTLYNAYTCNTTPP